MSDARTGTEWLGCTDPKMMLKCLQGRASERKPRLFACACCRRIWRLLCDERIRREAEVAERHADGLADEGERASARAAAEEAARESLATRSSASYYKVWMAHRAYRAVACSRGEDAAMAAWVTLDEAARAEVLEAWITAGVTEPGPEEIQRQLHALRSRCIWALHDLVGNPFRPLPTVRPGWLRWNDGIMKRLAEDIYEYRLLPSGHLNTARLAVLADMLEEAGCVDGDLLTHLRSPGPHVRSCWAVDLLLDKG